MRNSESKSRGHSLKLRKPKAHKACRKTFFAVRTINAWNSLPESVVSAPSLNAFKARLDRAWTQYQYVDSSDWYQKNPKAAAASTTPPDMCEDPVQEDRCSDDVSRPAQRRS